MYSIMYNADDVLASIEKTKKEGDLDKLVKQIKESDSLLTASSIAHAIIIENLSPKFQQFARLTHDARKLWLCRMRSFYLMTGIMEYND